MQLPERERTKLLAQLKEAVSGALPPPGRNVPSIFVAFPGGRCPARTSAGAGPRTCAALIRRRAPCLFVCAATATSIAEPITAREKAASTDTTPTASPAPAAAGSAEESPTSGGGVGAHGDPNPLATLGAFLKRHVPASLGLGGTSASAPASSNVRAGFAGAWKRRGRTRGNGLSHQNR